MTKDTRPPAETGNSPVVTPDNPLLITDQNRTFDTVTIEGGKIDVVTPADSKMTNLIKKF